MSDLLRLFTIDPDARRAPYQQICDAVVTGLQSGMLHPGGKLPTVRGLAAHLSIAPNTVASAYRELERQGILEGRGRSGTFISAESDPIVASARSIATTAAEELLGLGLTAEDARTIFDDALKAVDAER